MVSISAATFDNDAVDEYSVEVFMLAYQMTYRPSVVVVPPVPPTVTLTGIVNVFAPVTVTTRVPLIVGVEPECPAITTVIPDVRPWAEVVVMTVGLATEDDTMAPPTAAASLYLTQ